MGDMGQKIHAHLVQQAKGGDRKPVFSDFATVTEALEIHHIDIHRTVCGP